MKKNRLDLLVAAFISLLIGIVIILALCYFSSEENKYYNNRGNKIYYGGNLALCIANNEYIQATKYRMQLKLLKEWEAWYYGIRN